MRRAMLDFAALPRFVHWRIGLPRWRPRGGYAQGSGAVGPVGLHARRHLHRRRAHVLRWRPPLRFPALLGGRPRTRRLPRGGRRRPPRRAGGRGSRRRLPRRFEPRDVPRRPRDRRHGAFGRIPLDPDRARRMSWPRCGRPWLRLDRWLPAATAVGRRKRGLFTRRTSEGDGKLGADGRAEHARRDSDARNVRTSPGDPMRWAWSNSRRGWSAASSTSRAVRHARRCPAFDLTARVDARAATPAIEVPAACATSTSRAPSRWRARQRVRHRPARGGAEWHARRRRDGLERRGRHLDELFVSAVGRDARAARSGERGAGLRRPSLIIRHRARHLFSTQMGFTSAVIGRVRRQLDRDAAALRAGGRHPRL